MSKMKVQDATKELSRRAAKLLGDVTGVRTAAEKTLAELRKIENGFTQQQEAEREEKRREEQQKALSSQSKAWTMPDDVPVEKAEEKAPVEAAKPQPEAKPEAKPETKPETKPAPAGFVCDKAEENLSVFCLRQKPRQKVKQVQHRKRKKLPVGFSSQGIFWGES